MEECSSVVLPLLGEGQVDTSALSLCLPSLLGPLLYQPLLHEAVVVLQGKVRVAPRTEPLEGLPGNDAAVLVLLHHGGPVAMLNLCHNGCHLHSLLCVEDWVATAKDLLAGLVGQQNGLFLCLVTVMLAERQPAANTGTRKSQATSQ